MAERYALEERPRGATSFLVAAGRKSRSELQAILTDDERLRAAAFYHKIPAEWAKFWIGEELNRNDRRSQ
jgi:hypothetical protein